MAQASTIEASVLQQLLGAVAAGNLRLVDEHGQPLALLDALDRRCWAHLTDAADGQVYVHEFAGSRALQQPQYLELLGINV
jgi:hypothetical protein